MKPSLPGRADLHTPDELLALAERLQASGQEDVHRAVVLEAIAALEAYVQRTVFGLLTRTMDPLLVRWIDENSRMRFEDRLGTIAPVALGKPIDKSSALWLNYKRAKEIRNGVTHRGRRVSNEEARFVLETVRSWLAYLGSTVDVALALDDLKSLVEGRNVAIPDERSAVAVVRDFFANTASRAQREVSANGRIADLVLTFSDERVVVEVKVVRDERKDLEAFISAAVQQARRFATDVGASRVAVILLVRQAVPEAFAHARLLDDAGAAAVVIRALA